MIIGENLSYNFIPISLDRNIRYNFHGSRSRAKVIRFQLTVPLIIDLGQHFTVHFTIQ